MVSLYSLERASSLSFSYIKRIKVPRSIRAGRAWSFSPPHIDAATTTAVQTEAAILCTAARTRKPSNYIVTVIKTSEELDFLSNHSSRELVFDRVFIYIYLYTIMRRLSVSLSRLSRALYGAGVSKIKRALAEFHQWPSPRLAVYIKGRFRTGYCCSSGLWTREFL